METKETVHSDYEESQGKKLEEETTTNSYYETTLKTSKVTVERAKFGIFIFIALVCFAVAIFLGCKAYDVKNNYYSYENKYVNGDAYNFIINAGYFAGYLVSCAISVLGGIVSCVAVGIINAINKSR